MSGDKARTKVTLRTLFSKSGKGEMITMLTCYDYPTAYFMEEAGLDILLVGDSLGMTILGYDSTLPVTMDIMIAHAQAVRRGSPSVWLVGDMPYMTYQPSVETAMRNAGRFMAEAGCDSVKLEGGRAVADRVEALTKMGIPVMGHLGLTPQSAGALGGFRVQGRSAAQAKEIVDDAKALEDAGVFAILLEMVPSRVCKLITERSSVPIIGLGSGPDADGQVLIFHDMFGLYPKFTPKMARVYGNAGQVILDGLKQFVEDVVTRDFPQPENWFTIRESAFDELKGMLD
jgi:3-methyl-2-oxobutanoate hydroxymethyltransferase